LMHAPRPNDVQLIEVPYAPWGQYFPDLPISSEANAQAVLHAQIAERDAEKHRRCRAVIEQLTERQRDVLRAFAGGLSHQEVAKFLHITIKTVDAHKTRILELCREIWLLPEGKRLSYHFLHNQFADYFTPDEYTHIEERTHERIP
jgi:CRISPR-associated protein Csx14